MATCPICQVAGSLIERWNVGRLTAYIRETLELELPPEAIEADYEMWRCPRCSLEYSFPMLPGNSAFYHWLAAQPWYFPPNRWEWDVVIDAMKVEGRQSLLEVGCGSGIFLERVRQRLPLRAVGLDLTEGVVATCLAKGLEVYQGAIEAFPQQYGQRVGDVDCVAAFHCLEHVPDPVGFVKAMADVAGPAGTVFVSTPYSPLTYERMWPDPLNGPPHHMTRWNAKSYTALGERLELGVRFSLPDSAALGHRVSRSFGLVGRRTNRPRSRVEKLMKAAGSPIELIREIQWQANRDRVNGKPAADVVLVQFAKGDPRRPTA